MGRKAISGEPKTDTPLRIRLTDEERSRLDAAAELAGKPTSAWARDALLALATPNYGETTSAKHAPRRVKDLARKP